MPTAACQTARGLDQEGHPPPFQLSASTAGYLPSLRPPRAQNPGPGWGQGALRRAHCFPEFSPHLSICPQACRSSQAPFQGQSHLPHCLRLETGSWPGHLILQPSKPGSHLVLSGQPPESLSNLFFHIHPECPSLPQSGLHPLLSRLLSQPPPSSPSPWSCPSRGGLPKAQTPSCPLPTQNHPWLLRVPRRDAQVPPAASPTTLASPAPAPLISSVLGSPLGLWHPSFSL